MFEYSLVAGLTASGADAYLLHVTTTPSVAYIARVDDFDCGIMISASHNPYYDNGIKLIDCYGEKMPEETLLLVEDYIDGKLHVFDKDWPELPFAHREHIGCTVDYVAGRNRYMGYLISMGIYSFKGVKVGLDCANGSSWNIAKSVFDALGADTYVINNNPNGLNINNNAGSTHIEGLQKFVVEKGLDVGFAYDGDADRCLCVDEKGNVITGDHILYIYGCYMKERGKLLNNTVVTTVMSNFGLYKAFDEQGIGYAKTAVGDKYVYEYMAKNGCRIGGEQSGHIIFSKYASTGDGIHIRNNRKVLFALAFHELPNHNFKRVLRYKTTDDKVVVLFRQSFFSIPVHQLLIVISQLTKGQICTIRNKCSLRISAFDAFSVITLVDILLDIHRVTDSKVAIFDHHLLRNLPILPNWCRPFCPHPLMSIRVQIHSSTQFMDFSVKMTSKRPNAASHDVNNRMRDMVFLDMFATSL